LNGFLGLENPPAFQRLSGGENSSGGHGYSPVRRLRAMVAVANEVLGDDYYIGWVGSAHQELASRNLAERRSVYSIMVFLILAAQYERWTCRWRWHYRCAISWCSSDPCGVAALNPERPVFSGRLITLIGLAAKNAI
jgi:multidrug efflux pump